MVLDTATAVCEYSVCNSTASHFLLYGILDLGPHIRTRECSACDHHLLVMVKEFMELGGICLGMKQHATSAGENPSVTMNCGSPGGDRSNHWPGVRLFEEVSV